MLRFTTNEAVSADSLKDILLRSTLGERRPVDDIRCLQGMIEHSNLLVTAWDGQLLVGIARSVTDFHYSCYLSDLAVDVAHQRQGIGRQLVQITQEALGPRCKIILLSAPAAVDYYLHLGFERHDQAWVLARTKRVKQKAKPSAASKGARHAAIEIRDDIRDSLRSAGYSRDILWLMVSDHPESQRFADGTGRFVRFFEPTLSAHYVNFVITLTRLYDASSDAFSLNRLFELVAPNPSPRGKPLEEIRMALDAATVVGRQLYLIRSKRIVHRTDKMLARDIYAEASMTYDATRDLLRDSRIIFSDLSYHLTREDFSDSAEPDFRALLNAIS